ncbi:MAG TPA: hypothetical protein VF881_08755, partial [Polyangiaceae bacterium]
MLRGLRSSRLSLLATGLVAVSASCVRGAASPTPTGQRDDATSADPARAHGTIGPGRVVPDVIPSATNLIDVLPDGSRRLIVAGIRVIDHPDGSIERAREILPSGTPKVVQLPNRVGGGLLFYIVNGGSTQLWRAKEWLDKLTPVAEVWGAVADIVPGFDRVYARLLSGEIRALDLDSGRQLSLGNLPAATRIGFMAFADAWRGVAVVDFRGALATFDAGNSWRPIPLETQNVSQVSVRDGSFVLETSRGRVLLSANGEVARDESHDAGPPRGLLVVTENPLKSPSVSDR